MIKKVLAVVFTVCALLGFTCIRADAARSGDWKYSVLSDGTIKIKYYYGKDTKLTVPDAIDGKKVTEIGADCFSAKQNLVEISIPEHVTRIHSDNFRDCSSLENIFVSEDNGSFSSRDGVLMDKKQTSILRVPERKSTVSGKGFEGVTRIGDYAFYGCKNIRQIEIPRGITEIGKYAFCNCEGLSRIKIPYGVTEISYRTFMGCGNLVGVSIPKGVVKIGEEAFCGCSSLSELSIPKGMTEIEAAAFSGCKNIRHMVIPKGVTKVPSRIFSGCENLEHVNIPDGVTVIGDNAFEDCYKLENVDIPESVCRVGCCAFSCSGITRIEFLNADATFESEPELGPFNGCSELVSIILPKHLSVIGEEMFCGCASLKHIGIPDSVRIIHASAFKDCKSLESLDIPPNVAEIHADGKWGYFTGCANMKSLNADENNQTFSSVNGFLLNKDQTKLIICPWGKSSGFRIPDSVTAVGKLAFAGNNGLAEIDIPDRVTRIEARAFAGCRNLQSIRLPRNLNMVEDGLFHCCNNLERVQLSEGITSIGESAFEECRKLENIHLPGTVKVIQKGAFAFSGLTMIEIPGSVTELKELAFCGCGKLEKAVLSRNLNCIGQAAFVNCKKLKNIEIPEGIRNIYTDIFQSCTSLERIDIPRSVEIIDKRNCEEYFGHCIKLKFINVHQDNKKFSSVNGVLMNKKKTKIIVCPPGKVSCYMVPKGVETIGNSAFRGCVKLQEVKLPDSVTEIRDSAFCGCKNLESVRLPKKLKVIRSELFCGCKKLSGVRIPVSVKKIEEAAFQDSGITSVEIPENVTDFSGEERDQNFARGIFTGSKKLKVITIKSKKVKHIYKGAFRGLGKNTVIKVPKSCLKKYKKLFKEAGLDNKVKIKSCR